MPYSEAHANHAINFIEQLKLTKGRWAGQPFKLLPWDCLLYTSPSPRDRTRSRMPSSA